MYHDTIEDLQIRLIVAEMRWAARLRLKDVRRIDLILEVLRPRNAVPRLKSGMSALIAAKERDEGVKQE